MTRPSLLAGALLALCTTLGLAAPAAAAPTERSQITFDRGEVAAVVGDKFTLTSRITSPGTDAAAAPLIAHLDVVSRTTDVYVDPEDWSSERTVELDPADAEGGAQVAWDLQAVNAGRFAVYVVLLPADGAAPLVVSQPVPVTVAGRRTLTPGHALPVAVAIPLLLGLATAAIRLRQRRS
jgi:hypothetical protein